MFLNYLKNFFLKYKLKSKWQEVSTQASTNAIQTVGLVVDESVFVEKQALIQALIANGFSQNNITILVYRDQINKKESFSEFTFSSAIVNWSGEIQNTVVTEFIQTEFDLLISYYAIEKAILLLITNNSKAQFKVGFSAIDKKFNHLMITTRPENYSVFVHELFKYLKILNKIES